MIPRIIPLTSHTPRLRQHVLRSPVARRRANSLSTKAAQIPKAVRHHERGVATRSAQTLEANMSHDTTNHPAHQPHAAFTPACFALPSGTAPRKLTSHQSRAHPNGTATSRTYFGHNSRSSSARLFPKTGHFLWDALIGHSCGTLLLLWDTLVGHSCCRALLWDTLVRHSCGTLL